MPKFKIISYKVDGKEFVVEDTQEVSPNSVDPSEFEGGVGNPFQPDKVKGVVRMNIVEVFEKAIKKREEGLKTNPRYDIDILADENDMVKLYFHSSIQLHNYLYSMGDFIWKASTERFYDTDIVYFLHKDYIEKITDGFTLAHLRPYDKN